VSFPNHVVELLDVAAEAAATGAKEALRSEGELVEVLALGDRLRLVGRLLKAVRWLVDNVDFEEWSGLVGRIIELVMKISSGGFLSADEWSELVKLFLDVARRLLPQG